MPRYPGTNKPAPVVLSNFIERNQRNLDQAIWGIFEQLVTGDTIDNVTPIAYTHGLGKVLLIVNAGADVNGEITITGTSVDRNTGVESGGATEVITIAGLTTDTSDTDAEGNVRHALADAYISTNWFKGALTLTTTDVDISDIDICNISFEQVNDSPELVLETFDISLLATHTNAWFYAYLYTIEPTIGSKVDITRVSSLEVVVGDSEANRTYRLRKAINRSMNGLTDGIVADLFFGPDAQTYWESVSSKVWFTVGTNMA